MTIRGTIRRVWGPSRHDDHENFVIIVEPVDALRRLVLFTQDAWLASLAERYEVYTGRPTVTVQYDEQTRQFQGVQPWVAS